MARYPGAQYRGPVPNVGGPQTEHRLFVIHIMEGSLSGTDAWIHDPVAKVSANFGNGKSDLLYQWVDTSTVAWAQAEYNGVSISVEHEGNTGDSLTASQLEKTAQILAWAHTTHGIPLQVTNDPNGSGVIGHGLLGVAGGNHPDCPGQPILNQRQAIVDRAKQILDPTPAPIKPKEVDMILHNITGSPEVWALSGSLYWHVIDPASMASYLQAGVPRATISAAEHAAILAAATALRPPQNVLTGSVPVSLSGTGSVSFGTPA